MAQDDQDLRAVAADRHREVPSGRRHLALSTAGARNRAPGSPRLPLMRTQPWKQRETDERASAHNWVVLNVSQWSIEPDSSPRRNQRTRCADEPWVNESGPRGLRSASAGGRRRWRRRRSAPRRRRRDRALIARDRRGSPIRRRNNPPAVRRRTESVVQSARVRRPAASLRTCLRDIRAGSARGARPRARSRTLRRNRRAP